MAVGANLPLELQKLRLQLARRKKALPQVQGASCMAAGPMMDDCEISRYK